MALRDRFCRVCAALCSKAGPVYPLSRLPAYVEKASECLGMQIDLERDEAEGLPGVVCKRCCQLLHSYSDFHRRVSEGAAKLGRILAMRKEKTLEQQQQQKQQQQQQDSGVQSLTLT